MSCATIPPHACITALRQPARTGQVWRCWCGQGWQVITANDVFTGGPILIWARVGWWQIRARRRLAHQYRSTG